MVKAESTDGKWNRWIEHVFGAADEVRSEDERPKIVERVECLKNEERYGLPGKDQAAFEPQRGGDKHISQVAIEEEILRSVVLPVERRPDQQEGGPGDF